MAFLAGYNEYSPTLKETCLNYFIRCPWQGLHTSACPAQLDPRSRTELSVRARTRATEAATQRARKILCYKETP